MEATATKPSSFLLLLSTIVLFGNLLAYTPVHADDTKSWPQLFEVSCSDGGCNDYQPQCPTDIQYFYTTDDSISIEAANTDGETCLAIEADDNCRFLVGDSGVTQITFDFKVSEECYDPSSSIAWLAFWMRSQPYSSNAEVDFIESKHGPVTDGLNINFDAHGTQVGIYCAAGESSSDCTTSSGDWTGSITAQFSGSADQVSVSVSNSVNSNVGTSTLTGGPTTLSDGNGYYFLMDMDPEDSGLVISTECTITVSNLELQGTVESTIDGVANCTGL